PKVYEADVPGSPSREALAALGSGIHLDDGMTAPAEVRVLARSRRSSRIELTLHEGRKHQAKRMLDPVGDPDRRPQRSLHAGRDLDGLDAGEWRPLTRDEVAQLRRAVAL